MVSTLAPSDETQKLWQDYKRDSTDAALRNKLVERYLHLVQHNARRVWARLPDGIELDDLVSAGVFGLIDAIEAFDITREVKFETYCAQRIRGAVLDELRANDWVPRLVRKQSTTLAEATAELAARHGRQPTQQELVEHTGLSGKEIEKLIRDARAVIVTSLEGIRSAR
jgi:RNA polymerase sigma factor for flagellar operon FliA